jgi:hypothetical protein
MVATMTNLMIWDQFLINICGGGGAGGAARSPLATLYLMYDSKRKTRGERMNLPAVSAEIPPYVVSVWQMRGITVDRRGVLCLASGFEVGRNSRVAERLLSERVMISNTSTSMSSGLEAPPSTIPVLPMWRMTNAEKLMKLGRIYRSNSSDHIYYGKSLFSCDHHRAYSSNPSR